MKNKIEIEEEIKELNRKYRIQTFITFIFIGMIMNMIVVGMNDNLMPVHFKGNEIIETDGYIPLDEETKYPFFGDVHYLGIGYFSTGDFLIIFGIIFLVGNETHHYGKIIINKIRRKK